MNTFNKFLQDYADRAKNTSALTPSMEEAIRALCRIIDENEARDREKLKKYKPKKEQSV